TGPMPIISPTCPGCGLLDLVEPVLPPDLMMVPGDSSPTGTAPQIPTVNPYSPTSKAYLSQHLLHPSAQARVVIRALAMEGMEHLAPNNQLAAVTPAQALRLRQVTVPRLLRVA